MAIRWTAAGAFFLKDILDLDILKMLQSLSSILECLGVNDSAAHSINRPRIAYKSMQPPGVHDP